MRFGRDFIRKRCVSFISEQKPLPYLGMDLAGFNTGILIYQTTCIAPKPQVIMDTDVFDANKIKLFAAKKRTPAKQMIGSPLWLTQSRCDLGRRIEVLASTASEAIGALGVPLVDSIG